MTLLRRLRIFVMVAALVSLSAVSAGQYAPAANADTIRIWGHGHRGQDYILTLMKAWQAGFRKTHPEAKFDNELDGNASAIGGLFTDTADLAIMDREASFIEVDAYLQGAGFDPFRVAVARGSLETLHHAPALVLLVNRANPLTHLSLQQVDEIFDADHRMGPQRYKTWGDLGLTGEWATKPIQLYMPYIQSAEVQFFERAALKGSKKFSCCMKLFSPKSGMRAQQQIAAAMSRDKYGLALSTLPASGLKTLALSVSDDSPSVLPTAPVITSGTYPLARTVYVYAKRKPNSPVPQKVAAFLAYIVSPEGQAIVASTGGYLPLSAEMQAKAREALQ